MMRRATRLCSLIGNLSRPVREVDPEIARLLTREGVRQRDGIELIASENFTSQAVLDCLGSVATNKYAEGLPGARYYGGTHVVDEIENLCRERALATFRLDPKVWSVNVQPYSGSPANLAVYAACLKPHDRLMGLALQHGGHLTHGFYSPTRRVSMTSAYYESLPYSLCEKTGVVDFTLLKALAERYRPRLLIAGGSAYPREWDYAQFASIAKSVGALLMVDMAHISGLVAGGAAKTPFEHADVVSTTTHKSLRGPRAGVVFIRRAAFEGAADALDQAVFPGLQGGPHMNQIAAVAVAMKEAGTPEFAEYARKVVANSKAMAAALMARGYQLASGGTDNHLSLLDLRPTGLTGARVELALGAAHITVNKNTIVGDKSAMTPGGVRLGTPAMTTRGLCEKDFEQVAEYIHRGVQAALKVEAACGGKKAKVAEYRAALGGSAELKALGDEVIAFSRRFPLPAFEAAP